MDDYNPYTDVPADMWSNNAISTMSNAKILTGDPDGKFRPADSITRGEFAAIAARFSSKEYNGENMFTDIIGHWSEEYINRAAQEGWISGYPDGSFKPDQYITRAEAMTLVNNILNRHAKESGLLNDMLKWPDNVPGEWYYTAVQEATNSHYYDRDSDGITRHGQKSENRATGFSLKKLGRTLTVPAVKIRFIAESNI